MLEEGSAVSLNTMPMRNRVQLVKAAFSGLLKRPPYRGDARARRLNAQISTIAETVARTGHMADEFCTLYDQVAPVSQQKNIVELQQIMDDFKRHLTQACIRT